MGSGSQRHPLGRGSAFAESTGIADALVGIGKMSCGESTSITIYGPRESGWLAAVAEWLFDLTVKNC